MKAIAIEGHGTPEQLRKRGLPRPEPAADELLIQVVVAGVSTLDCSVRRGESLEVTYPWVPGFEVAGVVEQLGAACGRFRVGERVWAWLPTGGGYAQFATARESHVAPMPASLLFEEAATLPLDGIAAHRALFSVDRTIDGTSTVAVRGAATGAGHLAVQIALAAGARVQVDALPEQKNFVERLGGVEWLKSLAEASTDVCIDASIERPLDGWIDLSGGGRSIQRKGLEADDVAGILVYLKGLVEQRRLRPRLFKILNIGKSIEAQEFVEAPTTCGKLALSI